MSTDSSFEMYEMLLDRQNITRSERLALKASMDVVDTKIKNLISHVKNRPRESDEELVKRMHEAEKYHATHPQTNKDEREFMRELKTLKTKRKELVEYNIKQGEIDVFKSQRSAYQRELKEKEACLDELYAGARKMRAAHKLNCDPNALQEETMSIPQDKFRLVIGTAGSNVKKMEDECFVCIDMDKGRADAVAGKLKLYFDPANNDVEEAKRLIQVILDTRIEEWSLTSEKITCLLNKRAAIVMKLQEMYNVRIDVSKSKLLCKVSGLTNDVDSVMTAINSLEVATSSIDLVERRVLMYLLGKGRPDFQSLLEEHSVDVHLDKDGTPPIATVVGAKASVITVTAILKQIVEANKEIEEEMTFEKHVVLDAIIGTKGVIISQLQRDFNVRLTVDKEKSTATAATVEIKGNAVNVQAVKEHIAERIRSFQSDTVVISIPEGLLAGILGKKGARISALRQKHPEVTIDVVTESHSIRLHSTEPVQRLSAVDAVETYIAANMQKDFPMNKSTTITLKGAKGAEARKHLSETLQLNLDIDTDNEIIHIRGRNPDIEQAIQFLTTFCEDNFETELMCSQEDAISLVNGKENSTVRSIENRYDVKVYFSRKNDLFRIVGQQDAVNDAKQYITDFLEGSVDNSALVSITSGGIGALVGRGGNHIKSFEKKHDVHVDILKSREQVRLHGSSVAAVESAKLDLLGFLDNLNVNVSMERVHEAWAGRCDTLTESLDDLLNRGKAMFGVGVNKIENVVSKQGDNTEENEDSDATRKELRITFFGTPRRATAAKEFVLDEISGTTTAELTVLPHHIEHLSSPANLAKLQQSANSVDVTVSLSNTAIVLKGSLAVMSKAKIQINRLLDFLFTGEFSSVVADSRTLLALWNFATELDFKNQVVGGQISFDMRMSCIRVYASTSISHTLGVEYVRNAIAECKKRLVMIEVEVEIYNLISAKKSVYFGPIETKQKCKLSVNRVQTEANSDGEDATDDVRYMIVIEGPTENKTNEGAAAMKAVIARLEKENWRTSLQGDIIGALIGKGGKHVKALREETGANINIDMRSGNVEVSGKEENVNDAKTRILEFVAEKERDNHVTFVPITPDCIAKVIGPKGATIRELRLSSKVVSIDIDREDNVIVVKGSVECGQQAREEIIALLLKDNIDISKLRYIAPEERKAIAKKNSEADKAAEKKKQSVATTATSRKAPAPAGTREEYLSLLNTPGISKNSVRRIRRKMRDEEEEQQQQQQGDRSTSNESKGGEDTRTALTQEETPEVLEDSSFSVAVTVPVASSCNSGKTGSPSSVVDPASSSSVQPFAAKATPRQTTTVAVDLDLARGSSSSSSSSSNSCRVPSPPVSVSVPPSLPSGVAGNLLSMILGTTPPVAGTSGSMGAKARQQHQHQQPNSTMAPAVGATSSYFKSRSGGRAIRLD